MISSLAGRTGLRNSAIYCASKHAVVGLARAVALDVAPYGITVNSVCPGPVNTRRARDIGEAAERDPSARLARRAETIPVGRLGTPADIAHAVSFLASDAGAFITGQELGVDGGLFIG